MNVLIVVTHLLGTGHLSRALTLAQAFMSMGHDITVASGGMPAQHLKPNGVKLHQLPALRSDGTNFTTLLTPDNSIADVPYLERRQQDLLDIFTTTQPDIIITELFPFGRRVLRSEFLALLSAAKTRSTACTVLSSIRDILAPPSKPDKALKTDQIIDQFYDGVLVHSDKKTTPLEQSWPVSNMLSKKLHYTGYVAPTAADPHPNGTGANEVIVSAGGGAVGTPIFECAIKAAHQNPKLNWRMLVGGADVNQKISAFQQLALGTNMIIEPTRPDFRQLLHHAACSVSMCGYNTALDMMQTGTPSVFVPFDDGDEVEQSLRAESLAKHPSFSVLKSSALTPESLLSSIHSVLKSGRFQNTSNAFNGAVETIRVATELAGQKQ